MRPTAVTGPFSASDVPGVAARRRWGLTVSRAASGAYTACFLVGTILSVRRGHKAAPLGIRTPFSVPVDVAVGMGTGLAAPWQLVALLGAVFVAGSAAEPISHRLLAGRLPRDEATLVVLDLALPITILVGTLLSLVEEGTAPPGGRPVGDDGAPGEDRGP